MLEPNWRICDLETVDHGEIDNIYSVGRDGERLSDHRREGNENPRQGHMISESAYGPRREQNSLICHG